MWQFARAVEGITAACRALDIPITGGNVSLYNETDGNAIYPTPVLGVVGLIEDAEQGAGPRVPGQRRRDRAAGRDPERAGWQRISEGGARKRSRLPPDLDLNRGARASRAAGCGAARRARSARRMTAPKAAWPSRWPSARSAPAGSASMSICACHCVSRRGRSVATLFSESASRVVVSCRARAPRAARARGGAWSARARNRHHRTVRGFGSQSVGQSCDRHRGAARPRRSGTALWRSISSSELHDRDEVRRDRMKHKQIIAATKADAPGQSARTGRREPDDPTTNSRTSAASSASSAIPKPPT